MTTESAQNSHAFRDRISRLLNDLYDSRVEIVTTLLLAFAALMSAWCAYQSNAWGSQQSALIVEGNRASTQATRLFNQSLQLSNIDVSMFLQFSQAYSTDNAMLMDFIYERFRPEMKVAVDAWIATQPLQNPDAPPSPFAMEEYTTATEAEFETYNQLAAEKYDLALQANNRSTNYVLVMVLFATVLFFGGFATKIEHRPARRILGFLAIIMLVVAAIIMFTYPITS